MYGALIFAEIVSALKRALARVLVVIVCGGFGIAKYVHICAFYCYNTKYVLCRIIYL